MEHLYEEFKWVHEYKLNLQEPRTFSEKMQWIKLYGEIERFAKYTDKYEVRSFVKEKIGEQYLIPLIGVYEKVDDIPVMSLPNSFIMKASHGSGWNIIVDDKANIDWERAGSKMQTWLKTNYSELYGEPNYRPLKGRIVLEELLQDTSGDLKDYKFFCFHGNTVFIQVDGERFSSHKRNIYDTSWRKVPLQLLFENFPSTVEKPKRLDGMIEIAASLSQNFAFVRVDLYYTNDRIYFGELTFVPGGGFERFDPLEFDEKLGSLMDLTRYK